MAVRRRLSKLNSKTPLSVLLTALLILPGAVRASDSDGRWRVAGELYLWGADASATTAAGGDVDVSFSDVLDNLEMGFMGTLAARKDRWTLFGDLMYVGIDGKKTVTVPPGVDARVQIEQDAWIITAGAGYAFAEAERWRVDGLFGARYFNLKTDVNVDFGGGIGISASDDSDLWDAVVGLRGRADLSERWYLNYYGDIGTGDSDFTWQALVGLNYRFDRLHLGFGYRHLEWQFDSGSLLDDFSISGPYAGIGYQFR